MASNWKSKLKIVIKWVKGHRKEVCEWEFDLLSFMSLWQNMIDSYGRRHWRIDIQADSDMWKFLSIIQRNEWYMRLEIDDIPIIDCGFIISMTSHIMSCWFDIEDLGEAVWKEWTGK